MAATKLRYPARSIFFASLAAAVRSGHEPRVALELMGEDDLDPDLAYTARALAGHIAGKPFSDAMATMPRTFEPATVEMVREGERSGKLADALELLAADNARVAELAPRLALALIFPGLAIVAGLIIVAVGIVFVIPAFKEVFVSFGADLPVLTLAYLGIASMLLEFWYLAIAILVAVVLAFAWRSKYAYGRTLDRLLVGLPLIGAQWKRIFSARMAGLLADAARTGIDVRAALTYLRDTTANQHLAERTEVLRNEAGAGAGVASWLAQSRSVPRRLSVAAGVQSDPQHVAAALAQAAWQYAEAARIGAGRIERNAFILAYLVAGLLVGSMVIAMYLPIFKMGSVV